MGIFNKRISKELLRDEKKHIKCNFKGNEDMCRYSCEDCAIALKTDGDLALSKGLFDDAIKLYGLALSKEPTFAEAWVNLGNSYGFKSDYNNALSAFEKAISYDNTYGKALLGKAITLKNLNKFDEAIECLDATLQLYDNEQCKKLRTEIEELKKKSETADNSLPAAGNKFLIEVMSELIDCGVKNGYLSKGCPHIPELNMLESQYLSKCYKELRNICKDGIQLLDLSQKWAFYGGMGAAAYWHKHWQDLKYRGIYTCLATERGFDYLDEYVIDLVGLKWESDEEYELRKFILKSQDILMSHLARYTSHNNGNIALAIQSLSKAMFNLGVGVELNRLGMK